MELEQLHFFTAPLFEKNLLSGEQAAMMLNLSLIKNENHYQKH